MYNLNQSLLYSACDSLLIVYLCFGLINNENSSHRYKHAKLTVLCIGLCLCNAVVMRYFNFFSAIILTISINLLCILLAFKYIFKYDTKPTIIVFYIVTVTSILSDIILSIFIEIRMINNSVYITRPILYCHLKILVQILIYNCIRKIYYKYLTTSNYSFFKPDFFNSIKDFRLLILTIITSSIFLANYFLFTLNIVDHRLNLNSNIISLAPPVILIETILCLLLIIFLFIKTKSYYQYKDMLNNPEKLIINMINQSTIDVMYDFKLITKQFLDHMDFNDIDNLFKNIFYDFHNIEYDIDPSIEASEINLKHIYEFIQIFMMDIALQINYERITVELYRSESYVKTLFTVNINELEKKRLNKLINKNLELECLKYAILEQGDNYKMVTGTSHMYFLITLRDTSTISDSVGNLLI